MKNNILIATIIVLLSSLCFFLFLFYNQNRVIAQDIYCHPEIPIGEALEGTGGLLDNFILEIQAANYNASKEIESAEAMIGLAEQCNINKCKPVCDKIPYECGFWSCPPKGECFYVPKTCYRCEVRKCSGRPCPNNQIGEEYSKIESYFNQIAGLSKRIENLLDTKDSIKEALYKARQEFDNCAFSPEDWLAAEKGEKTPRYTLSCSVVLTENLPREEKDCKSLYNFFCCR